jgi:hypothetical protein
MTGFAAKALKLMIIGNFDVVRTILVPFKTYSPLVMDNKLHVDINTFYVYNFD